MFPATHRSSSGDQKDVFAAPGLHTSVVAGRCHSWVGTQPQTYVKPEAANTVFELLMMSDVSMETCWAIRNVGIIDSNTWSHLVGYVYCTLAEVFLNLTEGFFTLTEVFPCFSLGCKANARVKLAKTGHGPHSSTLVVICVVRLLFVLFHVLFVCKCVLPPGDNPIAVNKYINISNIDISK